MSRICKAIETENGHPKLREGEKLWTANRYRVSIWGDENIINLDCDGGCITL